MTDPVAAPRTLYLCPDLRTDAHTGGSKAHRYVLARVRALAGALHVVGLDPGRARSAPAAEVPDGHVFGIASGGFAGRLRTMTSFALHPRQPYQHVSRNSPQARAFVRALLEGDSFDRVVIDHFEAFALLDDDLREQVLPRVVYVAHNHEARLVRDIAHWRGHSPSGWLGRDDVRRVERVERRLLQGARRVVFLSAGDRNELSSMLGLRGTEIMLPLASDALLPPDGGALKGAFLFVCNAAFPPNLEALSWVCTELAPRLVGSGVRIDVTGVRPDEVPVAWRSECVRFLGFLPGDAYRRTLAECRAMLCPIELGAGVKIKALEALASGKVVLGSRHVWEGFGIDASPLLERRPQAAAELLQDLGRAEGTGLQALAAAQQAALRERLGAQEQRIGGILA